MLGAGGRGRAGRRLLAKGIGALGDGGGGVVTKHVRGKDTE